jgi:hypothetical protein
MMANNCCKGLENCPLHSHPVGLWKQPCRCSESETQKCHMISQPTLRCLPKRTEKTCPQRDLRMEIHRTTVLKFKSSFIHTMECCFAIKGVTHWHMLCHAQTSKHCSQWEEPDQKDYVCILFCVMLLIWNIQNCKMQRETADWWLPGAAESGERAVIFFFCWCESS